MKILIITDSYPPEIRSASHLMYEFAHELRNRSHNVTVLTTAPKYNLSDSSEKIKIKFLLKSIEDGIVIIKISTPHIHNVNIIRRAVNWLILPLYFYIAGRKLDKPQIIFVYSPPMTLGIAAYWLKNKYKSKFIFNVQDLFPQNAIDLGIMRNKIVIRFFEWIEKRIYKKADLISVHSERNKEFLIKKGIESQKIQVVYNWIDTRNFQCNRQNEFRSKLGLNKKFIILFAGIIGPAQGLEIIVLTADLLKHYRDIIFLLVGDGLEKRNLQKMVIKKGLKNIYFHPFIKKEMYPYLVKDCDVGLVSLSPKMRTPVVPGKILGYMAAGIPIIACLNKESDGHMIIKKARCGYSLSAGDYRSLYEAILRLYQNKYIRRKMGSNGKKCVDNNFSKNICISKYENIFSQLLHN
ncbi:MAG: glycosyltransferase family 4 protein [Candidatus Lokiarchaeia archaeon]